MPIIEIKNLSFAYESQLILENINLTVEERDFLAIVGPNGGGKSTLLKLILGINPIQKGVIKTFGPTIAKKSRSSTVRFIFSNIN